MGTAQFYESLSIASSFREVSNHSLYTPLPEDWYLALADVRGSTDAIRLGKYKEVNMAGASIIAALNNLYQKDDLLPYLFGGDGSMIALPNQQIEKTKGILAFCKKAVKDAYGLEMAIGVISIKELREKGHDISVARLQLSEFIDQAIFWEAGLLLPRISSKKKINLKALNRLKPISQDWNAGGAKSQAIRKKWLPILSRLLIRTTLTAWKSMKSVFVK